MGAAWGDHGWTIVLAVLMLPGLSLVAYRWRRRGMAGAGNGVGAAAVLPQRVTVAEVGLVAGTLPWLVMLCTPQPGGRSLQLVPLRDLVTWGSADVGTGLAQVVGNLLVLAAFGFFGPVRFAALASLVRVAGLAAGVAVAIEALQWVLAIGRVSSLDDVLVNTVGAVLAALLSRPWWRRERGVPHAERSLSSALDSGIE